MHDHFATLYDHHVARVYTYIRYRVDSIQTAEDLTSQTFEKAFAHLSNYKPEKAEFGAWLFGIAHNVVSRHYRKKQRWLSLDMVLHLSSDTPPPEEVAIQNEMNHQLLKAVQQLDERERNLIALKFAAGLNNRQIAAITSLSDSNVGVILFRAIKRLRHLMEIDNERS